MNDYELKQDEYKKDMLQNSIKAVWRFDDKPEFLYNEVPSADNWIFVTMPYSRIGSTILMNLLEIHPSVYSMYEENLIYFFKDFIESSYMYYKLPNKYPMFNRGFRTNPSSKLLRELVETVVSNNTSRPIIADKSTYHCDNIDFLDRIFPKNKKVLPVRNILDSLSSNIRKPWFKFWADDVVKGDMFEYMKYIANDILDKNTRLRDKCFVFDFERMSSPEKQIDQLIELLEFIGLDKSGYNFALANSICHHPQAIGRWRQDELIYDFMNKLLKQDRSLWDLLQNDIKYRL